MKACPKAVEAKILARKVYPESFVIHPGAGKGQYGAANVTMEQHELF
jgi:hypothetical protein